MYLQCWYPDGAIVVEGSGTFRSWGTALGTEAQGKEPLGLVTQHQ